MGGFTYDPMCMVCTLLMIQSKLPITHTQFSATYRKQNMPPNYWLLRKIHFHLAIFFDQNLNLLVVSTSRLVINVSMVTSSLVQQSLWLLQIDDSWYQIYFSVLHVEVAKAESLYSKPWDGIVRCYQRVPRRFRYGQRFAQLLGVGNKWIWKISTHTE